MANDPILYLLGMAKKAGKLEIGEEPVGAVCRSRHARLLLLAGDTSPNTCRRAAHFGEAGNVLWLQVPQTKEELGFALGRKSCAMLAVTDFGLAAAIADKLAAAQPERYGPAAEQLRTKADRALQRQKEKRQHEKNVQQGKKKPWAAPPKENKPDGERRSTAKKPARPNGSASRGTQSRPRTNWKKPGVKSAPGGKKRTGTRNPKK